MLPFSEASDAELLATNGVDAFAELYDRHAQDVLRYFTRRTGCAQTAADLTSETFAQALMSRSRFHDTGAPGRSWLFKIAQRQLSRFIRTKAVSDRARHKLGMQRVIITDDDTERIERHAELTQLGDRVRHALDQLPPTQADAVRLRITNGLPYTEVASQLGCSEGAARVRVSRGLSTLAHQLGDLR